MALNKVTNAVTLDKLDKLQVKELQQLLVNNGEAISVDGILGPATKAAFANYKKENYMSDPDLIGPGTIKLLIQKKKSLITFQLLKAGMPNASDKDINLYLAPLQKFTEEYKINTPIRIANFLAQLAHESGSFRYKEEIASGSAYEGRRDLGNTITGDGKRFKG
jgi:putative chitinase